MASRVEDEDTYDEDFSAEEDSDFLTESDDEPPSKARKVLNVAENSTTEEDPFFFDGGDAAPSSFQFQSGLPADPYFGTVSPNPYIYDAVARALQRSKPRRNKCKGKGRGRKAKQWDFPSKMLDWQIWEEEYDKLSEKLNRDDRLVKMVPQQKPTPSDLIMPLMPFQREFLAWSLEKESSAIRGGILSDEMGMGKTIQAISLILAAREAGHGHSIPPAPMVGIKEIQLIPELVKPAEPPKVLPTVNASLVVCPVVAVKQWKEEIARFTKPGSLNVLVFHGKRQHIDLKEISKYDVVITTYSILEADYRNKVQPPKQRCQWCRKLFLKESLQTHLRYHCGPSAQKSEKQAKQVKKNGMPVAIVAANQEEEEDLDEGFGKRRMKRKRKEYVPSDIVLEALKASNEAAEKEKKNRKGCSILHSIKWMRLVLDEAHTIKDRASSTAKSIYALKSCYRWALSGTPLQNRVSELYSLIRYLEIYPYSYFFCRKCDCKSLDHRFGDENRKCEACDHSPLQHFCWWNKFISNPIKKAGSGYEGKKAMDLLKLTLLNEVLLRRTKQERAADLALPPRTFLQRQDRLDEIEDNYYTALFKQTCSDFSAYVESGTVLNNYAHIFDLITRLRQAVDHPYLVTYSASASKKVCDICQDSVEDPVMASCKHAFCRACVDGNASLECPTCKTNVTVDLTRKEKAKATGYKKDSILNRINLSSFRSSTKIEALKEEVMLMLEKDPAAKGIVFSQFTSMLDLIGFALEQAGLKCVKLDGSLTMNQREKIIDTFRSDPECKIFLMSLKAGGVALNLTIASHVFLMDPWWNPAVEQQAQDRIHRIGQLKPMRVVKFVIANTIEERILNLQEKKRIVFHGTIGGCGDAMAKLSENDLKFLFTCN